MEDSLVELNNVEHIFLFTEIFERLCPYYISIGMTYDQYWRDDPTIAKIYRRVYKIKQEETKWNIYEGGMYTYEALCKVSPVLHAFAKNGTKPLPFSKKPYGIEKIKEIEENIDLEKEKQKKIKENERLRAQIFFNNWYKATKKHFEKKEGEKDCQK